MKYGHKLRRFTEHTPPGKRRVVLGPDHLAVIEGRTLFPTRVRQAEQTDRVLKWGKHSRKIGAYVVKGRWWGKPIYTLTLEERATCPRSCVHYGDCYGNKMWVAYRYANTPDLLFELDRNLRALAREHPQGYVVRLHVLGDFIDKEYLQFWLDWLDDIPQLHVFGYTAHPINTPLGRMIRREAMARWDRFAIRQSNDGQVAGRGAVTRPGTIENPPKHDKRVEFVCPAETGRTECCGTCGACWSTNKTVVFMIH